MRLASIVAGVVAVLAVVALLAVELSATALATRAARQAVERCVEVEELEVTSLARPAVLALLRGEARDVRVRATGVQAGDLRIEAVAARVPVAPAGWGGAPETVTVVADVVVTETDLERYLVARSPELASPTLAITPDGLQVGDERVPFTLELLVVRPDERHLRLVPTLGDPRLWASLGLELDLEVPSDLALLAVELGDGRLTVTGRVELPAGVDRQPTCPDIALLGAARPFDPVT